MEGRYVVFFLHKVAWESVIKLLCSRDSHDLFVKILVVLTLSGDGILLNFWSVFFFSDYFMDFRDIQVDFVFLNIFFSC